MENFLRTFTVTFFVLFVGVGRLTHHVACADTTPVTITVTASDDATTTNIDSFSSSTNVFDAGSSITGYYSIELISSTDSNDYNDGSSSSNTEFYTHNEGTTSGAYTDTVDSTTTSPIINSDFTGSSTVMSTTTDSLVTTAITTIISTSEYITTTTATTTTTTTTTTKTTTTVTTTTQTTTATATTQTTTVAIIKQIEIKAENAMVMGVSDETLANALILSESARSVSQKAMVTTLESSLNNQVSTAVQSLIPGATVKGFIFRLKTSRKRETSNQNFNVDYVIGVNVAVGTSATVLDTTSYLSSLKTVQSQLVITPPEGTSGVAVNPDVVLTATVLNSKSTILKSSYIYPLVMVGFNLIFIQYF